MSVDLEVEMLREKQKRNENTEETLIMREVDAILSDGDNRKKEVLFRIGMGYNINRKVRIDKRNADISKFDPGRVFTLAEVKNVACKYGLRFLPSDMYRGQIDPELPYKILEFEDKHALGEVHNKYFIMAPKASFELQERPVDPLFFYNIDNGSNFYLIHKWGNDLSIGRYIANLFFRNPAAIFAWFLPLCVLIGSLLASFVVNPITNTYTEQTGAWVGFSLVTLAFSFFTALFSAKIFGERLDSNNGVWNSKFRTN